ncbi:hypothetical protein WISP_148947 [Willisornis vidua]|uniref:TNFR-Cys domain-containing protein n=1 Tax=Willisornis vidua TaxID=1566151 RepID=A0ABQ9CKA3_9PASS|nr:hypothetical protein WISP_148947 [Willisornis vidua]
MRHRCTATADTECSPCQDEYFSTQHHHSFCNSCTVCNTSSLSLLLFCLVLLMVSGMSILLLIIQAARKDTQRRPCGSNNQRLIFPIPCCLPEDRSCRIPIQEEQIDSNSSLIKN